MVSPIEVVCYMLLACESQEHFQKCFLFTNVQSAGDGDMCIVWRGTACPGGRVSCASSLAGGHGVPRRMCRIHHHSWGEAAPRGPSVIVFHRCSRRTARYHCSSIIAQDCAPLPHCARCAAIPSFHHSIIPSFHHSIIPSFHHSFHHSIIPSFHHSIIPSHQ